MASHEDYPDKVFVPLDAELLDQLEAPFGIMEFMTEDTIYECPFLGTRYLRDGEPVDMYLHWFNTTIRLFRGKPWASHADVQIDDDRKVGVVLDEDTIGAMLELHYPYHESPFIDPASVKWLAERAMAGFDDEVDEL